MREVFAHLKNALPGLDHSRCAFRRILSALMDAVPGPAHVRGLEYR
jgi:hypothetical protein